MKSFFLIWSNICTIRWNWIKNRRIKGKKQRAVYCKTHNYVPTSFALAACYSKEFLSKENEYFSYRGEDCNDVFAEEMEKYLSDFADLS